MFNWLDLENGFKNNYSGREDFYSKFWLSSTGINNGKFYAMLKDDLPIIFELTIHLTRLPEFERELKDYNNFIFSINGIDFFLDYFSETIDCYLSAEGDYDSIELEGEDEYIKEKMIYRRIEGELLELF